MPSKKEDVGSPLKEKVALVTGASRGLGKGIAQALGKAGATVYVTGRTEHVRTEMVLARRGGKPLPYAESPHFVGRTVVALAQDAQVMEKSGQILSTRQLAREYGFTDIDGTQPPLDKGL